MKPVNARYPRLWPLNGFLCAVMSLQAAENPPSRPIIHAADVRTLSRQAAGRKLPVELRGVITFVDTGSGSGQLFMQDKTAGIFVFLDGGTENAALRAGQLVDVRAVTTAGDFSPCLALPRIKVLGPGVIPRPIRPVFDQFLATKEDGQWTELRGVVRAGETKGGRLFLNVATTGGNFLAISPRFHDDWERTLVDSVVAVRGALAPIRNQSRQAIGVRLFVPGPEDIRIEQPAPENPFNLPRTDAGGVGEFRPGAEFERRIRVRTTVTAVESGTVYVSDGQVNLAVHAQSRCDLNPGDAADIVGFPGLVFGRPGLQDSLCRKLTPQGPVQYMSVSADAILPEQNFTDPSGFGQALATRFDMKPVRIAGTLLTVSKGPHGYALILESGKRQYAAVLPDSSDLIAPRALIGDQVQLTGVCLVTYDQYHRGQSFRILLRNLADITVTASSPWWNLKRAMWGLAFAGGLVLLAAAWIGLLRHQVKFSTRELRTANESLSRLSCEDFLTGAANRRQFDAALRSELGRSRSSATPLSLLLIDIDHFKALNDRFGHLRGDDSLTRVARTLQSALRRPFLRRTSDWVARYGGEEFAVILPETGGEGASEIAESMRGAVLDLAIPNPGPNPGNDAYPFLTISIGIATFFPYRPGDPDPGSAETLIALADEALYQAKRGGRNRCVLRCVPASLTVESVPVAKGAFTGSANSESLSQSRSGAV